MQLVRPIAASLVFASALGVNPLRGQDTVGQTSPHRLPGSTDAPSQPSSAAAGWLEVSGQAVGAPAPVVPEDSGSTLEAEGRGGWSFSASAYAYFVPDDREYVQPTFTADRDGLHLEARYNYEDLETGSAWVGYNLGGGEKVAWELTPMLGGVFGNTTGIAPGYKGALTWWQLELYSEGEYVIDAGDTAASFFYTWSELSLAPVEWFRFGLVTQRTKVYDSDREIQRGLLAGFTYKAVALTTYVFNPDESRPLLVVAVGAEF